MAQPLDSGASIPQTQCISSLFLISPFFWTFFRVHQKFSRFDLFLKIFYFLSKKVHFPLCFTISLCFRSVYVLLTSFTCVFYSPPYVDHHAFMHHTMHVLDAPESKGCAMHCYIVKLLYRIPWLSSWCWASNLLYELCFLTDCFIIIIDFSIV